LLAVYLLPNCFAI